MLESMYIKSFVLIIIASFMNDIEMRALYNVLPEL
jgi:hypothetical protein